MAFDHPVCTQVVDIIKPNDAASAAATNNALNVFAAVSDPALRRVLDLRGYSSGRLIGRLGGTVAAATKIRIQYHAGGDPNVSSADAGWTTVADTGGSHTSGQAFITPVITLSAGMLIENVLLRAGIFSGDGAADPTITVCTFNLYRNVSFDMERLLLIFQTMQNIQGLRKNMRDNALGYKSAVAADAGKAAQIAVIMSQDATQYLARIQWQQNLLDGGANQSKMSEALSGLGSSLSEMQSKMSELQTAANNLSSALKTSVAEINTASDAVLSQVAAATYVY